MTDCVAHRSEPAAVRDRIASHRPPSNHSANGSDVERLTYVSKNGTRSNRGGLLATFCIEHGKVEFPVLSVDARSWSTMEGLQGLGGFPG